MTNKHLKLITESEFTDIKVLIEQDNKNTEKTVKLRGPYAVAGVENANKRKYILKVLETAINDYRKNFIEQKRSVGELNHPSCLTKEAQILTKMGWRYINEISDYEEVYSLNPETYEIELHQIKRKIDEPYKGKMLHFRGRSIDLTVTPNHKIPTYNRYGKFEFIEASEIFNNRKKYNKHYIPKKGIFNGEDPEYITIKGIKDINPNLYKEYDPTEDLKIKTDVFVKFLGFWLAEGYTISKDNDYRVGICQNEGDVLDEFVEKIVKNFPKELQWKTHTVNDKCIYYELRDRRLHEYLARLGKCYDKYIPNEIKQLSPVLLEELLYWYNKGDGRDQNTLNEYRVKNNFTVSRKLIEDLSEIQFKAGMSGNISTIITEVDYTFADHIIKAENKVPLYQLHQSTTNGIYLDERFLTIEEVDFDDRVYCVEVENNNFYVMENGKTCWTGNSIDVDYNNACHLITSMEQDGNVWIGESKVLTHTPKGSLLAGLLMDGVKVGMSTRGVGNINESKEVDDYKLITVDVVHEPSAPGCFMEGILESKNFMINKFGEIVEVPYEKLAEDLMNLPKNSDARSEKIRNALVNFLKDI